MQRQWITTAMLIAAGCLLCLLMFSRPSNTKTALAHVLATPAAQPKSTTSTQSTSSSIDPTVLGALIGGGGAIIAALIAGAFVVYQVRRTAAERVRNEEKILRLQKELEAQSKTQAQDEEREAEQADKLRRESLLAKTTEERVAFYRKSLHADPRISCLQILNMSRPLDITNVYVRVRLHEDVRPNYALDPILSTAEGERDPNALLRAGHMRLESRSSSALDPDDAIRRYPHCVIVGDPGAGKTTLLKYLTLKSADKQLTGLPDLPIHIGLNDFVNSGERDLLDFAATTWDERYGFFKADARAYMDDMLKKGQALLLLDALDETVMGTTTDEAEASYKRVADAIGLLTTRYSQSPIVVTARKAGYQQRAALVGFTELEVLDFRQEDIEQFIDKWFACYHDSSKHANAADLNARLQRNPRIQALAANPLLLSLIVLVYEKQLDLPDRRAELYKHCVDVLLTEWDSSRNIRRRREFKPEQKRQLLEELAWHFHSKGLRYFPDSEVRAVIAGFLPAVGLPAEQNKLVLDEIANENGLLKEQAQGWHGFLHLTLQEYFVAQYVTDHHKLETLLAHRSDPWWEEVLLLYAGQTPDASPLLQKLLGQGDGESLREDLFDTNLILAGRCLAARPTVRQADLREEVTSRLFNLLLTTSYSLIQKQVAETLAAIDRTEVNRRLLYLLSDEQLDSFVRQVIVYALGELGDRSMAPVLLGLLSDPQLNSWVRRGIAYALRKLGDRSMAPVLLGLLSDPQLDSWVPHGIANALGELGDRSMAPVLLRLLSDKRLDSEVRRGIAYGLGKLGDRSIVPALLGLLTDKQLDFMVREGIAEALSKLGDRSVVPVLLHLLSDEQLEFMVRRSIAKSLGELGDRSIVPALLGLLTDKQLDSWVREGIASALGKLGDRSVVPALLGLLTDKQLDFMVREGIAEALGELGDRSVVPVLVCLVRDEQLDSELRREIAYALGKLGDRSIVPVLLGLLREEQLDSEVRGGIAKSLGELGDRSIVPALLGLLSDEQLDSIVRGGIAQVLGQLANDASTVEKLATLVQTPDIADDIHGALWAISLRAHVRVFVTDGQVEVVQW